MNILNEDKVFLAVSLFYFLSLLNVKTLHFSYLEENILFLSTHPHGHLYLSCYLDNSFFACHDGITMIAENWQTINWYMPSFYITMVFVFIFFNPPRFLYDDVYWTTLGVGRSFTNKNFVWCYLEERIEVLQSIWHYADSATSLKKVYFIMNSLSILPLVILMSQN